MTKKQYQPLEVRDIGTIADITQAGALGGPADGAVYDVPGFGILLGTSGTQPEGVTPVDP